MTSHGSSHMEQARLEARMYEQTLQVEVEYVLRPDGNREVPLLAVLFEPLQLSEIRAFWKERPLQIRHAGGTRHRMERTVLLPEEALVAELVTIRLQYLVLGGLREEAADLELKMPLLLVVWPPPETTRERFVATVRLDRVAWVYSSLPTGLTHLGDEHDGSTYQLALPVQPSLLRLTASTGNRPLFNLERSVDAVVILLLVGFTLVGWRHFRRGLS